VSIAEENEEFDDEARGELTDHEEYSDEEAEEGSPHAQK